MFKIQPFTLIVEDGRYNCDTCGDLAVIGRMNQKDGAIGVVAYCQDCFEREHKDAGWSMNGLIWQPATLIIEGRLECKCGALAVIVSGGFSDYNHQMRSVRGWCHDCYVKMQEQADDLP